VTTAVDYAVIGGLGLVTGGVVLAAASSRRGAGRVASHLVFATVIAGIVAVPVVGSAALAGTGGRAIQAPRGYLMYGFALLVPALAGAWFGWRADARPLVAAMSALGVIGVVLSSGYLEALQSPARFGVLAMLALTTLAALGWREVSTEAHRARVWNAVTMELNRDVR
jgi:hypothetical protein